MNPNTNQPQNQGSNPQSDPTAKANQGAASLAFASHLQTQMMQHQVPPAPEETQSSEGKSEEAEPKDDKTAELENKIGEVEKKMEESIQKKFDELKQTIQDALSQDDEEETKP